tara:strand:+ start:839 stop:1120 length:282 start_codon:yes stop_codon:yes gene_type:complete
MNVNYTEHSLKRMQQRGIDKRIVQHLLNQGEVQYDGHGCKIFFLNKKNRKFVPKYFSLKDYKKLEKKLASYVVISADDNTVITVGHRLRRRKK